MIEYAHDVRACEGNEADRILTQEDLDKIPRLNLSYV